MQIWLCPEIQNWGMTTRVQELLAATSKQFRASDGSEVKSMLIAGRKFRSFKEVFNGILEVTSDLPKGLEMFLVPNRLAYIAFHSPIGAKNGYPMPLGILSFAPDVVKRAQLYLQDHLASSRPVSAHADWSSGPVLDAVIRALTLEDSSPQTRSN